MSSGIISRRDFLTATTGSALASAGPFGVADPGGAAAQAAGIKRGDLSDLTIKEVKVYVVGPGKAERARAESLTRIAAIVTEGGIEGNYTLAERYWHPNWSNLGWLEYAKAALPGKSVLDLLRLRPLYTPRRARRSPLHRR